MCNCANPTQVGFVHIYEACILVMLSSSPFGSFNLGPIFQTSFFRKRIFLRMHESGGRVYLFFRTAKTSKHTVERIKILHLIKCAPFLPLSWNSGWKLSLTLKPFVRWNKFFPVLWFSYLIMNQQWRQYLNICCYVWWMYFSRTLSFELW